MAIPQPPIVPVIKSLLKKSPPHPDSSVKHNRNVSFNRTVIVFCEELETPSLSDHFEPPLGYRDTLDSFEPPEDYSDQKVALSNGTSEANSELNESYSRTLDKCAENLTDDQLIGLLKDEFKLNCDDLSEEDFPVNYLNSNHSYLCVDAISDYDSDSESSLFAERKETSDIAYSAKTDAAKVELDSSAPQSTISHAKVKHNTSATAEGKFDGVLESSKVSDVEATKISSRQMPARVKVSTVDNANIKRQQQSRKDDQDARSKLELTNNRKDASVENKPAELLTSADKLSNPVKIKQSNVEPVPLSRSVLAGSNATEPANSDIQKRTEPENNRQAIIPEQILGESFLGRDVIAHSQGKLRPLDSTNVNLNQLPRNNTQNQIACQVCRAIDPANRVLAASSLKDHNADQDITKVQPSTSQSSRKVENQPGVYNQACISCRENVAKQNPIPDSARLQASSLAQARPVTYQLVYVVDQKGNRVRALSLRPASQVPNPQQQSVNGRRILIAQNNVRFPNPVAINGQPISSTSNQILQNQWSQSNSLGSQVPQYRIISSVPQSQLVQNQIATNGTRTANGLVRVPLDGVGLRQHTVYYVRQPLDAQNISQRLDATSSNSRPFPEPHEIRRLDGLRDLSISSSSLSRNDQVNGTAQHNIKLQPGSSIQKEETDDPTFGFSNRPSVKVVATNSTLTNSLMNRSQTLQSSVKAQYSIANGKPAIGHYIDPSGNLRPVSLLITGTQTLDRRQLYQQQQPVKENVPSTSSMSNIHGTMSHLSQNANTKGGLLNSHQKILTNQSSDSSTSNTKSQELNNTNKESKPGVIVNNRVGSMVVHSNQSSSHATKDAIYDASHWVNQEPTQVAYSMNI